MSSNLKHIFKSPSTAVRKTIHVQVSWNAVLTMLFARQLQAGGWVFVCLFLCFWFCFRGNWSSLCSNDCGSKLRFSNRLTLFPIISTPQMKKKWFKKFARRNSTFIPACMATTAAFTWKGQLVKHHVTLNVLNILKVRYWQALSCLCFPNDPNYIQAE